jgi:3-oxoacyl-(acyl-carrier-protein) synthase
VTAAGECVGRTADDTLAEVMPFLKSPKTRKYMGKQDRMAVIAAGRALAGAGLDDAVKRDRVGFYLAVGFIPFERAEIEALARNSLAAGEFSMEQFSKVGIDQVNPLLTFRCLPNMPMFHVSLNFGLRGPYFVTYPGAGQFYVALEQAVHALEAGEIDCALVGGVADQDNFLVSFHHGRMPPYAGARPADGAAFVLLERARFAEERGIEARLRLVELDVGYQSAAAIHRERFKVAHDEVTNPESYLGAASTPWFIAREAARAGDAPLVHAVETLDGLRAGSRWERA